MFGVGRGVTFALVGWLWADLLLGAFAIFLAANSAGAATPVKQVEKGIDPTPIEVSIDDVNGVQLLFGDPAVIEAEQKRISEQLERKLKEAAPGRRVAVVLAYGAHESPTLGDRIARLGTDPLRQTMFDTAVVKIFHELRAGNPGTSLALEVYLYN